jgi:hypothetical protein
MRETTYYKKMAKLLSLDSSRTYEENMRMGLW